MTSLAVSAIGADRPGIVAAVTRVLYDLGANIEDTSMTILRGHFAMMLVVAGPLGAAELDAALEPVGRQFDLVHSVREISDDTANEPVATPYAVVVYGADRPGIVARVTGLLAERGANIVDLSTRLHGEPGAELCALAAELGVEATLRPADADIL